MIVLRLTTKEPESNEKMTRRRYLKKSTLENAQRAFFGHSAVAHLTASEYIPTADALGRITAAAVFARISSPSFHCSAMDGIAVRAEDTFGASETRPISLQVNRYQPLDTGDPIPEGMDAVIMIEDVIQIEDGAVSLTAAATPWQHIRMVGEDVVATEMLLPRGHTLRAPDIAVLLACGVQEVEVRRRPRIAVIPTGDELVDASAAMDQLRVTGRIIESNSHLIGNLVREWGGDPVRFPIIPDDPEAIRQAVLKGSSECDAVAINAGSSAGSADYVPEIIAQLGELIVHGVEIMPGKPMSLGVIEGKPVIGVPGYPVSAYVVCDEFLHPLITSLLGIALPQRDTTDVVMGRRTPSRLGSEEYVRVRLGDVDGRRVAIPLSRGASLLNSVVRADGIVRIPSHSEGIEQGESVTVERLCRENQIQNSLLAVGSHDILLDLIADEIRDSHPEISISSAHVGSLAGLTALKRGEAHIAGVHLLDEQTGEYNVSYVNRLFQPGEIALINLAYRQQGLIVLPGNPKNIQTLEDLRREDVVFINRQRGSGTRILLDYELKQCGIGIDQIRGYERELYTHLAVAAAVESGAADAGLGILAVARALGLDFIPVAEERYDLAMKVETLKRPQLVAALSLLQEPSFDSQVAELGGYDLRDTGTRFL